MGSMVPGAEGEGRLISGYGALDDSNAFQQGEGLFTESRGLEPYVKADLDRKYGIYGAEEYIDPNSLSPVPLGRQAIFGESLPTSSVLAESQMVPVTYRDQPEALGKQVGRQPSSDLWKSPENIVGEAKTFFTNNPVVAVAVLGGVALLGYWLYKRR